MNGFLKKSLVTIENQHMLGIFPKKSKEEVLQKKYAKLMGEAHKLSTTNRRLSDEKVAEAEEVLKQIEKLARI